MKFIRRLLLCLALALALVAVLVGLAFIPEVQTWVAQRALARQPGLKASLGSLAAGLGKIDITNLRLTVDGAVLKLPSLHATLPVTTAGRERKFLVQSLVAKGWILDLSRRPPPEPGRSPVAAAPGNPGGVGSAVPGDAATAQTVARVFGRILREGKLPCDVSLDGVELEGDVVFPAPQEKDPIWVHVLIKGGGLAAGHEGVFAIEAAGELADLGLPFSTVSAQGRLVVAMESPRTVSRIEIQTHLSARGHSLPKDLVVSAAVAAAGGAGEETYTLDLSRGERHVATIFARLPEATHRWVGTWKVDLRDSDLVPFLPHRPLPSITAAGDGDFEADTAFARIHALGRVNAAASNLGVLAPPLDCLGAVTIDARFDLAHSGQTLQVDRLSVSLAGARPAAVVQALQPFSLAEKTGELKVADPRADWLAGTIPGLPLAWLAGLTNGFTLAGGDVTGEFSVRADHGAIALRAQAPFTATGVSVQRAGRVLGQELDLALSPLVDYTPPGWQVQWAPLTAGRAGRRLATLEAGASRKAGYGEPVAVVGKWTVDLGALAALPAIPELASLQGRTASGDFSASVGTATVVEGKLAVIGHDPGHSFTASGRADVDADGGVAFEAPVKIALGPDVSEVTVEGTWTGRHAGSWGDVRLTGKNVALGHLGLLTAPLRAAGAVLWSASPVAATGGPQNSAGARDRLPFWGDWVGRLRFEFDRLRAGKRDLNNVSGIFAVDHGTIHLKGGQGGLTDHGLAKLEGAIAFDAAAELPYSLNATAAVDEIEAAPLFGPTQPDTEPVVKGRFSITGKLTGNGINLSDLLDRTQEEFRLTSNGGTLRLLKTNVGTTTPEAPTPVSDALYNTGTFVGSLFRIKSDKFGSGQKTISKTAAAVLNFTYQVADISYDQISVTATRGADRTLHLVELVMSAPNARLTGSGQINYVKGQSVPTQPLSVELQLSARGNIAELLAEAGLLSSRKDALGYTLLNQAIHFGGTLEHIDGSQWHDLLAEAKAQPDHGKKKGD